MKTFKHTNLVTIDDIKIGYFVTKRDWESGWYRVVDFDSVFLFIQDPQSPGNNIVYSKCSTDGREWLVAANREDIPLGDAING